MKIEVENTWHSLDPGRAEGKTAVVIDVLRATSTITAALAQGCLRVIPVSRKEQAITLYSLDSSRILGGERSGEKLAGFHVGNSPEEYTPHLVKNKEIILTTTNGTAAVLKAASMMERVFVCCPLNAAALASHLYLQKEEGIVIVCAGLRGKFALEDFLSAGMVVEEISICINDVRLTNLAREALRKYSNFSRDLYRGFLSSSHGKRLIQLGLEEDLRFCSRKNEFDVVPYFDGLGLVKAENKN